MNASQFDPRYDFPIEGVCYIGQPKPRHAAFAAKKVEHLLEGLRGVHQCLIFIDEHVSVPFELEDDHCFIRSANPANLYADVAERFWMKRREKENKLVYQLTSAGYWLGEGVTLGKNVMIEPAALIGHGVSLGNDSVVMAGAVIKHTVAGNGCIIKEHAVVGDMAFAMCRDDSGNHRRIYPLGGVRLGDGVEIGAHTAVCCGTASDTILANYVKVDNNCHIGHDSQLENNVTVVAGSMVGGYVHLNENAHMGLGSMVRNRLIIGKNAMVGMGAVVVKDVPDDVTVAGLPAKPLEMR